MNTGSKDFYKILGVAEGASKDEVRKAYRKLAKRYHPDANSGDVQAAERFKEVSEAHAVLSNDEKRKQYDQIRKFGGGGFRSHPGGWPGGHPQGGGPAPGGAGFSFDDLGGLGDIFSSIFDRGRRGPAHDRTRGPRRGEDVESVVEIAFETAVRGGKVSITVPITEECATCSGSGAQPGTGLRKCGECGGLGTVSFGQGGFAVTRPCPACMGQGNVPEMACVSCGGRGAVRQNRTIEVAVPPGVDTGSKLRLSGQGTRGTSGGEPGDLILTFRVRPHRFFKRKGIDVFVTIPINVAQAILGSKVKVRTVDGPHVVLKVPPGTQSGRRFRIKGHGVRKDGRRGDQYVEVRVEVPESIPDEAKDKVKAFAELAGLRY